MDKTESDTVTAKDGTKAAQAQFGGVPGNAVFIPIVIAIIILHALIIFFIYSINTESSKLSQTMQDSSAYITDATSLLAGSSLLSETSSNYVVAPVNPEGEPTMGPLLAYANELAQTDHRGDQVEARFETYRVDEKVFSMIQEAADSADALIDAQLHAIALVSAVHPLPDHPALAALELPELSAEEAALSDDEKMEHARVLLFNSEYGSLKQSVSSNVNGAVGIIRGTSGQLAQGYGESVSKLRILLWVFTIAVIVLLCISFVMLYRLFISPINRFSQLIVHDKPLDESKGLRETRVLAGSYNNLLHRHNVLEGILREAAETDTLTGLPNRYSLEQHLLDIEGKSHSLAVFQFDVNYLKRTNDTLGHAAGDDLIRRAGECISTCFAMTDNGRCYRLGGDEFAAILKNTSESEIAEIVHEFEQAQARYDVSISWGYAYTEQVGGTSFKALMDEADRRMYQMKEKAHRES